MLIAAISLSEKGPRPAEAEAALNHGAHHAAAAVRRGAGSSHRQDAGRAGLFGAALFFGETMITPAISPGSDQNSLNRAVRAVLADVGSVLTIDERVADAFAAPADDLQRYHYAWAAGRDVVGRHHPSTRSARWRTMGAGGDVSLLEATRDRGRQLAAGGKGKP